MKKSVLFLFGLLSTFSVSAIQDYKDLSYWSRLVERVYECRSRECFEKSIAGVDLSATAIAAYSKKNNTGNGFSELIRRELILRFDLPHNTSLGDCFDMERKYYDGEGFCLADKCYYFKTLKKLEDIENPDLDLYQRLLVIEPAEQLDNQKKKAEADEAREKLRRDKNQK